MSRLALTPKTQVPPEMQPQYTRVTEAESGLQNTYQALFANPQVASRLASLDDLVRSQDGLDPSIRLTVALTVAHERKSSVLWDSFEPLSRQTGVSDAVIDGIAAGTAPRGLLPKDGIWVQSAENHRGTTKRDQARCKP